ncbi:MAG: AlpA family transcriptional regulator [Sulfuritalea sp.]|nr:AlpA family transcriptional regulator [Sulfuritalea sp.]
MPTKNQAAFADRTELRIARRKKVESRTGLSRSSIYAGIKAGTFPKPIQLGTQSVGWLESEIDAWLRERIAASRGASSV